MFRIFCLLLALGQLARAQSQAVPALPREMRAAWIATVYNLDWPSAPGLSQAAQQAELSSQIQFAADLGLNTLIFQVRSACDSVYASKLDPWSAFLTGTSGQSPGYDPLAYAIQECHQRGIELHAWFNPFRAKTGNKPLAKNHVSVKHPEWLMNYAPHVWLDPGIPAVRAYTMTVVEDLLARYDLDGIHIDDYFYPYPNRNADKSAIPFPDALTHQRYGAGKDVITWRRENIDQFVENFYRTVKSKKPHVKVGISPFGIWQPGVPAGIQGILNAYTELAADAKKWVNLGWADYFAPQLYWRIDPPEQSFPVLLNWWQAENKLNRSMCPGIGSARVNSSEDKGRPASEMVRQIELTRTVHGHAHWNLKALRTNTDGLSTLLKAKCYQNGPTLPPACPWLAASPPPSVRTTLKGSKIAITPQRDVRWLTVQAQLPNSEWRLLKTYPASQNGLDIGHWKTVALRWVSATGIEGPATVIQKR